VYLICFRGCGLGLGLEKVEGKTSIGDETVVTTQCAREEVLCHHRRQGSPVTAHVEPVRLEVARGGWMARAKCASLLLPPNGSATHRAK
jgi:hypothetical protein